MNKVMNLNAEVAENEKLLIKSEKFSYRKFIMILFAISLILFVIIGAIYLISDSKAKTNFEKETMSYSDYLKEFYKDIDPEHYSYDEWLEINYKDVETEELSYWDWSEENGYGTGWKSYHPHQDKYDKYEEKFEKQYEEHRAEYDEYDEKYNEHIDEYDEFRQLARDEYASAKDLQENTQTAFLVPAGVFALAVLLLLTEIKYRRSMLVITDKRAFGVVANKHIWRGSQRVDLPLDSISAVSAYRRTALKISTSSGVILFSMIKNRDEMHSVLSKLLVDRQTTNNTFDIKSASEENNSNESEADELAKFKKLLDDGVITQEEFDAKKKQIFGL